MKGISEIFDIGYRRWKAGGTGYLFRNIFGYPHRTIKNTAEKRKKKKLVEEIRNTEFNQLNRLKSCDSPKVVVSLTSYYKRVGFLEPTLKSLLMQTILPDKITVYFGSDTIESQVPDDVLRYRDKGIEFIFDGEKNLKPHKKYFYAMQEYPSAKIITVDDDIIYPHELIERLIDGYKNFPHSICATRVHKITFDSMKQIRPYETWKKEYTHTKVPSNKLVAIGCGGVLYPPNSISKKAFDAKEIIDNCLNADDIWLKFMEIEQNSKVVYIPLSNPIVTTPGTQGEALSKTNTGISAQNDLYINNLMKKFGVDAREFQDI